MSAPLPSVPGPVVLLVLDGVGWGRRDEGDAVFLAETPILDRLLSDHTWGLLQAHGTAVGMPGDDDMGNSEVGHNAMGAGRVFDQGAKLVAHAIERGDLFRGAAWRGIVAAVAGGRGGTLHLLGLLSDGNVHSHVDHLHAMIEQAARDGVTRLRVHALTDGRDVGARSALQYIEPLQARLDAHRRADRDYAFATGGGRMHITMDRYEADWRMVQRGWRCHVHAEGLRFPTAADAVRSLYAAHPDKDDQYLPAFVVGDYAGMDDGDAVVFFNFRGDRAIEISRAFSEPGFAVFDRAGTDGRPAPTLRFAGMMEYDGDLHVPPVYLVAPPAIDDTVAQNLARAGKRCLAISETQKYGHVTYFYNGNRSDPPAGEDRVEVPSLDVTFDRAPAMSAPQVTERACLAIRTDDYDFVRINLANGDMVGHTGDLDATIQAIEVLDRCIADLALAVRDAGGALLLTADHGNADEMFRPDKKRGGYQRDENDEPVPSSSHSLNPVPVVLVDFSQRFRLRAPYPGAAIGGLAQLGATVLDLCGVATPDSYLPSLVEPA
ncbi:MAG: 2,3-bisphosphoglycerate-independent phosphoglycerate mutase [Alphaproteobacteria bacterium]|nr:2,3-bisphosphoglycerate-independent phosphoglycerate mutase [Alphaproteobacteria bacterium]